MVEDGVPPSLVSEWLGLPRKGGPASERVSASVRGWRAEVEQREMIRANLAAEHGTDDLDRAIARAEREIADLQRAADRDLAMLGTVDPARTARIEGARARLNVLRGIADSYPSYR